MRNIKFFILFALLLFFVIGYKIYQEYQRIEETQQLIVLNEGEVLSSFITAFRQTYQDTFLEHHIAIDDKTIHLLPVISMPEISKHFAVSTKEDIVIRTVSDRPRNIKNMANDFEIKEIEYFKKNPTVSHQFSQQNNMFHYTKPLLVKPSCLECHGKRENAIPSVRDKYKDAYDYKVGEVRGLLNIEIKKNGFFYAMYYNFIQTVVVAIFLYVLFLFIIYLLIRKVNENELAYTEKLEDDITLKTYELKKQRDTFETLFEKSSDGILIIEDNKFVQCNEKAVGILHFDSKEELLGIYPGEISPRLQPDGQNSYTKANEMIKVALEKGSNHFEWVHLHKNGKEFWTEISLTAIILNNKKVIYTVWRDISDKKSVQQKLLEQTGILYHQAHHDALTGLPNRTLFHQRLEESIERSKKEDTEFALFFIDLDEFKRINDSLGHEFGDKVLNIISERLKENIRKSDTLARLGGDEFIIIMEKYKSIDDVSLLAEKILTFLAKPIYLDGLTFYISSSIGISLYPKDDVKAENLLKFADAAMYKAKKEGKSTFEFYSSEMTAQAYERITMESDLRKALRNEEFIVYYQPQIDARDGSLVGVEALVRWLHPTLGLVSPAAFIPIAEESGFIVDIDKWVMKTAMAEIKQWYDEGLEIGMLSLNLTQQDIRRADFLSTLESLIEKTDFKSKWLELEISERVVMNKYEDALPKLKKLREMGISVAIDDFGIGHSSLSYLKYLPVSKLKIDQSFMKELPDNTEDIAIVKAIISLAQGLELDVIAEGVETEAQKDFLLVNNCFYIQGYFYGRPVPAQELREKYL